MNRALVAATLLLVARPAAAETLSEAVADAWRTNPTLAKVRAQQQALEQTTDEARAAGRLTASVDVTGGYDHVDYGKGGGGTLNASLPVWSGGRVASAVRVAQGNVAAGAEGLRESEAVVLEAVVGAYADALYSQQAVEVAGADITLLDAQVREAQARFDRGQATALITGASTGIGAIYADRLAERGYDLILVARNKDKLQTLATQISDKTGRAVEVLAADLGDKADLARVEQVLRADASITALVNNAGIGTHTPLLESDVERMDAIVQLNVTALMRLTYAAVPGFVARGGGTIINIASIVAVAPELLNGVYGGTKAFVQAFTTSLNHELGDKGMCRWRAMRSIRRPRLRSIPSRCRSVFSCATPTCGSRKSRRHG